MHTYVFPHVLCCNHCTIRAHVFPHVFRALLQPLLQMVDERVLIYPTLIESE